MKTCDPILFRQLPMIKKIIEDETWLEGERRGHLRQLPVVLGQGRRLFDEGSHAGAFKLVKSSTTANGVVVATYERDGEVPTGDFGDETPSEAEIERRRTLA